MVGVMAEACWDEDALSRARRMLCGDMFAECIVRNECGSVCVCSECGVQRVCIRLVLDCYVLGVFVVIVNTEVNGRIVYAVWSPGHFYCWSSGI